MIDLPFSRRKFLAGTSCFGALYALAKVIPLPVLAADVAADARVSEVPLVDKGFASVRKIGNGLYATISDPSKGTTALRDNLFVEQVLPGAVMRPLAEAEMAHYRRPFANPGEDRRPTLTWPRQLPLDGEPP